MTWVNNGERRDGRKSARPPTPHPLTAGAKNTNWSGREAALLHPCNHGIRASCTAGEAKPSVLWTLAVRRTPGRPEIRSPTDKHPLTAGAKYELVGARGFEPPTTATPLQCATRLRYAPKKYQKITGLKGGLSYLSSRRDGMRILPRQQLGDFFQFHAQFTDYLPGMTRIILVVVIIG
jgi:hypothetical protein